MKVLTTPRSYGKTDPEVFAMLRAAGLEAVRNETGGILDKEGMKALLADCDGVIVGVDPIDAEVIAAAPKLKAIAKYGVGVDNIDLDAAKARDIKVSRTVGANAEAVADYAMALLLAVARKTVLIDQHCRQGDWKKITTRDVTGGTIGILGLGAIGRNVAQRAQGFGMKVLAHDPFWDEAYAKAHGITRAAPDEIFAECDVISLHLPLTPETENFIGAAELAKMKPDASAARASMPSPPSRPRIPAGLPWTTWCSAPTAPPPRRARPATWGAWLLPTSSTIWACRAGGQR